MSPHSTPKACRLLFVLANTAPANLARSVCEPVAVVPAKGKKNHVEVCGVAVRLAALSLRSLFHHDPLKAHSEGRNERTRVHFRSVPVQGGGQFQLLQQCHRWCFQHQPKLNFSSAANCSGWVGISGVGMAPLPRSVPAGTRQPSTAQRCSPPPTGTPRTSRAKSLSVEPTAPRVCREPLLWPWALQPLAVGSTGRLAAGAS